MELVRQRYELAIGRIREIVTEEETAQPYREYFQKMARFLVLANEVPFGDVKKLEEYNRKVYEDILPEHYNNSYGNPDYAAEKFGEEMGRLLSFLYAEVRGIIVYAFEKRLWDTTVVMELFLEVYHIFTEEEIPSTHQVRDILYWYVSDYSDEMMEYRIREMLDPKCSFATDIIMNENLEDIGYLYKFGEYITENEKKTAQFLNQLSKEEIDAMARTYTEGYRIGFEVCGIDLSKKKVVNIRYNLGFERMVRSAILQFEKMGLEPVIYRSASHTINKRQQYRIGFTGAIPNKQYDYDHRQDAALYLDEDFVQRKLRSMQVAYAKHEELASVHAGPAVIEIFGEKPFAPESKKSSYTFSKAQQKLQVSMDNESSQITNRYIKGDERSFTIIAFPVPEIGERFEEIFRETVKINTLDYVLYQKIQQTMIDALDTGVQVHIKGKDKNQTDLWIQLYTLQNPEKETIFENCVADVNIPVGEVFTSPVLKGTHGVLNVSRAYLNELRYDNLKMEFTDGMISDYSCENFENPEENKKYILENILHHQETLPMGEFAVGTNTTAYVMAKKYNIEEILPVLIAEKMGPHFAVGDTCYSWAEDTKVYNRDGKEIMPRDNEVSILRKTDISKAYYGCHTDITIPYEELEFIDIIRKDESTVRLIEDGRFTLLGTEALNEPLDGVF